MDRLDDNQLLREYVERDSDAAFATIVERYVHLVYSAALRQTSDSGLAQEVTQAVFIVLAQKAAKLRESTVLSGWLFQTTRYAASDAMKREVRRRLREQEAALMESHGQSVSESAPLWQDVAPFLDDALAKLSTGDRDAIVLRFFENKNLTEVGSNLGISEEAARKRVNRAVEKLRCAFVKRGVAFSVVGLTALISANGVQAAPIGVVTSVTVAAQGSAVAASTSTIAKGTTQAMAWMKIKTAIIASTTAMLVLGTAAVTVQATKKAEPRSWQVPETSFKLFYATAPEVSILPTIFTEKGNAVMDSSRGVVGVYQTAKEIAQYAYEKDALWTIGDKQILTNRYDVFAKLSENDRGAWKMALQKELQSKLGIVGKVEMRETQVLLLRLADPTVEGFRRPYSLRSNSDAAKKPGVTTEQGKFEAFDQPIVALRWFLEERFNLPVIDQTGLTDRYDFVLTWNELHLKEPSPQGLKEALPKQLGIELMPAREKVEMLVLE